MRLLKPPRRVLARDGYQALTAFRIAPDQQAVEVAAVIMHHNGGKLRRGGHCPITVNHSAVIQLDACARFRPKV